MTVRMELRPEGRVARHVLRSFSRICSRTSFVGANVGEAAVPLSRSRLTRYNQVGGIVRYGCVLRIVNLGVVAIRQNWVVDEGATSSGSASS